MPEPAPTDPVPNVFDTVREPLLVLAADLTVRRANRAFGHTFGVDPAAAVGRRVYDLGDGQWDTPAVRRLLEDVLPRHSSVENFEVDHDFPAVGRRVVLINASKLDRPGGPTGSILLAFEDVTARRRNESLLAAQNDVFRRLLEGDPLAAVLEALCEAAEGHLDTGSIATVLLADPSGTVLRPAAGRRCPPAYAAAIDPVPVGPACGSCGTAAYRGEPVVVADIAADPLWADFRAVALPHGLRACWSVPIPSAAGAVLGTFAVYAPAPRRPSDHDLRVLELLARTAGLAIERRRDEGAFAEARRRSDAALQAGEVGTYYWDVAADRVTGDKNFAAIFGVLKGERDSAPVGDLLAVIHPDDRDRVGGQIGRTLETDEPFRAEYRVASPAGERWVVARGVVERGPDGSPVGWAGVVIDVTGRKRAEERLAADEARQAYLVELSDALRPLSDPVAVQLTAARVLGEHLRADRVLFFEVVGPDYVIERDYAAGVRSLAGRYPVASFGHELYAAFLAGRSVVEADATAEPGRTAAERASFAGIDVRGHVDVPLVKGGAFVAGMTVHCRAARRWTAAEVALVEQTAERTWAAVERAKAERALRAGEERFRSLFESMDEGYCVVEPVFDAAGRAVDYRYRLANPALERHSGLRGVVGRTALEIMPRHEPHWIEAYGRVATTGEPVRRTEYAADLGRWFDVSAFRVGDPAGRHVGVLFSDVTDRHRAEEAVRASERQLAEVFRHAPAFMGVLRGPDHVFELVNDQYDRLVGGRPLVGKAVRDALPEVVGQGYVDLLDRVYGTGEAYAATGATVALEPGGGRPAEERVVDFVYQPLRDPAGAVTGILVQGVDQTERAKAEQALRAGEEQFRTLFESMDEGYCVIEMIPDATGRAVDFRYTLANPAFANHTGMVGVVGRTVREMLPGYEAHLVDTYARVADTGDPLRFVDRVGDLDRWFDLSTFRVGGPGSRKVAVLFADITARKRAEDDRRRLASIVEHSPDFIGVSDATGNPIFVNPAGRRLVGLPPDADVAKTAIPDYFAPEQRPFVADTVLPAVLTAGRWTGELTFRHFQTRAGIPVLYDLFRVDDPATGKPVNFATVTRDLTGQKRAEALVRETDERLRQVLGATADYAVIVTDPTGRVTDWLGGAETITGFAPADAVGRPVAGLIFTAADRAAGVPVREMENAVATGRGEDKRWHVRRDGGEFFADGVIVPVRGEGGDLRGFAKVFRDATARKRAEDAVRFLTDASATLGELVDYESTLQRIANLAVGGFADWCVVDVLDDQGGRRRVAVTAAEAADVAAARTADAAFRPSEGAEGVVPHVLRSGEPEAVPDLAAVDPAVAPQGPDRLARLLALGVRSYLSVPLLSRGRVIGGLTFLSASPRRRFGPAEQRVAEDLAERVTTAIENARLYTAVQEQDRRKGEFLATLAHELRNPLAPVRTGVQILRAAAGGAAAGAAGRTLDMMDRQVNQLVHLVDDLMDVSRVSSGKVVLRPERLDLKGVVEAAVETSRQLIDAAGHALVVEQSPEPLALDADRTRLVQVLANLLNNAGKYTPNGGRITLTTARDGAEAVVRVADTGLGIPADMLPKVFDMFTQVGSSLERSQGGLGIGLTLVRRLVELHGGRVAADSPGPGRGSTFTVRLPLAAAPAAPATGAAGPAGVAAGTLDVLVVDDNRDAAESLAVLLEMKGHRVRTAHDGPAALGVLATYRPAVVFLDIGLPGMSGYEVARRVRESVAVGGVTLVALTGWGQEEDRRRTKEAGFDHHLVKPVDFGELEKVLVGLDRRPG